MLPTLELYRSTDDVFRDEFLNGVFFTVADGRYPYKSPAAHQLLESLGTKWAEILDTGDEDDFPPPGPYVAARQHLLEVFKLNDDLQGAFINGLVPMPHT